MVNMPIASSVLPARLLSWPIVTSVSASTDFASDSLAASRARRAHSSASPESPSTISAIAYVAIARALYQVGGSCGVSCTVSLATSSASANQSMSSLCSR